jgi:hypothetical protein
MVTLRAKDYKCVCGKRGEYLNLAFDAKWGNALCESMSWYPVQFSEYMKKHIHFSKVQENTWLVQSDPQSRCEAYYITILPHAIVMYGDYDGVIVKPHECGNENLIYWMADATTLSYFVEKVHNGNQHHQCMEFDEDTCKNTIREHFIDRFEIYDLKDFLKESMDKNLSYDELENVFDEKLALMLGCHCDNLEETYNLKYARKSRYHRDEINFDNMIKMLTNVLDASFENEWVFYEWMQDHDFDDVERYDYSCYTHQIKWQHECLLWWARHVIETDPEYQIKIEGDVK